jgi:hypothetical protein
MPVVAHDYLLTLLDCGPGGKNRGGRSGRFSYGLLRIALFFGRWIIPQTGKNGMCERGMLAL